MGGRMPTLHDVGWRRRELPFRRPGRWLPTRWKFYQYPVARGHVVLCARKWWGISALAIVLDGVRHSLWADASVPEEMAMVRKRKPSADVGDYLHLAAMESTIFGRLQPLVAHAAALKYDDKSPRKPGWWTVKTMGSAWLCEVKDPDTACRLVTVQQTIDDALTLASVLLESEEAPWEPDPWLKAALAKQKKN